ncbi:hypothetical protein FE257_003633 [Aspergillus nanangensis]|uniref:Major facilitator superfamily (MFS) profile domain-containing protein n=1 Tax=Aspergillus nanangensis TaxID=2582783 RepID=A0AAD4CSF9_ASPNN|nr:hypothetical protein FE257_003633 [Aspergillus nanangensis]
MAFGILQPSKPNENIGGTTLLEIETVDAAEHATELKRGTGRHATTILVPQPSDDPNDPLRWPLWRRDLMFIMYLYCTVLCVGAIGPLLTASAAVLAEQFETGFTEITLLTGYNTCAVGAFGIVLSALSRKYGKRPGYVFSMVCAFVGTVWGGAAKSYESLLGARIVQGFGVSMFESVMFDMVGDLYFVHERGARVAALTVAIAGMANLPTVLSGLVTTRLGWRWMFWMLSIFLGLGLVLIVLFGWETTFRRPLEDCDMIGAADTTHESKGTDSPRKETGLQEVENIEMEVIPPPQRKAFLQRLSLYSGSYSDIPLPTMIMKPFLILVHPAVIWSTLLLSISTAWYVVVSFLIAQIFATPPYLLTAVEIGYMSSGPVIGGTLGSIVCGLISDPIAMALARKNNGIYEAEFRLVLLVPMMVTGVIGWFLFGNLVVAEKSPAVITIVWGIAAASIQFCMSTIGTYMVDGYRKISVEVFIIGMVVKNFVFFGLSFGVNDWVTIWGPAKVFDTIGGIQLALCLLSGVVWIFGKKWRAHFYA